MKKNRLEMIVGSFMVAGFLAFVFLALSLGEVGLFKKNSTYTVDSEFDNVAGVKKGASVQIAGVVVGEVSKIWLDQDEVAHLGLQIDKRYELPIDSIASIKSTGIIGGKFIQISMGGDDELLIDGGVITETESSLDIESLISKFAFGSAK